MEQGRVDQTIINKQQEHLNAFNSQITQGRTQPRSSTNALTQISNWPTINLTNEGVTAAKQATGSPREAHVTVYMEVRVRGKISSAFGSTSWAYPECMTMAGMFLSNPLMSQVWRIFRVIRYMYM